MWSVGRRQLPRPRRHASFAIEGVPRSLEQGSRLLAAVADRGDADQPVPAERGQHVEDGPRLGRVVEAKLRAKGEVEDVVWLQGSVGLGLESSGEKVDGEPADDATPCKRVAYLERLDRDLARVFITRRKHGAEEGQPAGPAQQLVVRRQLLDLPERRYTHLHARATELPRHDKLLNDAAARQPLQESLSAQVRILRAKSA